MTLCFLYITRMPYFRPVAGKNKKKRANIGISLADSSIQKYIQL
ncbi:hypothetical protein HMPREF2531_04812 [Bacteroides intestinalis]|uniref:Uncharacterized protein n=1 Tax=Bacteroides intestinalis TaxID=329854 RepID=A0A139KSV7_9BACE|nr:hypothetical protein HMPREF2531_04812 [Bacteroides intestinalis]